MFFRQKKSGDRTYLQLVESRREGKRVRQRVIATIGRIDDLRGSGQLDRLLASGARMSETAILIAARERGEVEEVETKRIGAALIFERLWRETGCHGVISSLLRDRGFQFSVERAVFITVLHRLFESGSDRQADRWKADYRIEGADEVELHHLYRAMAWLGEELPGRAQLGRTPFAPRCTKDLIEEQLFLRSRDLFSSLDVVFFDTTSIYFEGEGGETLGQRGNSKDHRPDLKQMVVGVIIDADGRPICCELWPGNTTDVTTLVPIVDRLRTRFSVNRVCVVADRGMISKKTIAELEKRDWLYILGARMRSVNEVKRDVLSRAGRYKVVRPKGTKSKDPSPLKVKQVMVEDRRYIVCLNEDQAKKDAADREAIVSALRERLKQGDKSLVGNKGFRKFVATGDGPRFTIDVAKIKKDTRYDGKWVLRTNTDLSSGEVALKYMQLLLVEDIFRTSKSILATRPIFHRRDATIRGHVFCSFLALVLRKELQDRLAARDHKLEWRDVTRDLDELQQVQIQQDGKRFLLRSATKGAVGRVFAATGVALPRTVIQLEDQEA